MGGTARWTPRCWGGRPVSPCPINRRLWRCAPSGTQHLFRPGGAYLCRWLVAFRTGGVFVVPRGWPARVQASRARGERVPCDRGRPARVQAPPSEGHGRPCARPLEARAGWLVRVWCTSGRSASAARGVRGVRAAQQSKQAATVIFFISKRNASSLQYRRRVSWKVV